ncbi:ComEA family DNA-binding protein [uncultured Winogradskyella sp.]|uniref:ComEA family DNA-binding protein n=1 Tax=uncultured Winogradskyella sp. TaxID=395353 RepID=UPI003517AE59
MKSHFQFSNNERNGIFLLLTLIFVLQGVFWYANGTKKPLDINNDTLDSYRNELDSLRQAKEETAKPKLFPFNPNFISDYKGYTLGMTAQEIDRLQKFRDKGQWINSVKQFQDVTKVSDSLLNVISPYFKFPEWVTNPKPRPSYANQSFQDKFEPKPYEQKIDLNKATASQLQTVYGVGEKLSQRIVNYRNKFEGGFYSDVELSEIYGLMPEVIDRIKAQFTVKTPRVITKFNLNTATRDELVTIPYVDYEIANNIIEERTLRDGFRDFEELTKVEHFPLKKIEIIKLYLHL